MESKPCCYGQQNHSLFKVGQVGFAPWPPAPTPHFAPLSTDPTLNESARKIGKGVCVALQNRLNGQGSPPSLLLLRHPPPSPPACYRGAAELRWARVSSTAAHISNFLLTTKAIRKLPFLTLCTEPLFIRRIRARPAGSWFISANKGFGQQRWKHLFWGLNILYLSELSRLTENCYDVHNYTSFFFSSSALAAVL